MPEGVPEGQILGIEGTAWNLSASVFGEDLISLYSNPYSPPSGGIHPREAAQHHASVLKEVVSKALSETDLDKIAGVAFSQGPGLGPCLRTVGTAARTLALTLGVPLIGVNHCVAHVEIGRFACGCKDPIVLYASGANTQVLGFLRSRYRIFGETLDIGLQTSDEMPRVPCVLFDANALMIPGEFGVDVFTETEMLIGSYEPITLRGVVNELEGLSQGRGRGASAARVGLRLSQRCTVCDNPSETVPVDDMIVMFAENSGCIVMTNDRGLKKKLSRCGIDIIVLRNQKTLDIIRS